MILIADSGSTKCDWILLNEDNHTIINRIRTSGVNPSVLKKKKIREIIHNCNELNEYKEFVSSIYFFGAGCNNIKGESKIKRVFMDHFTKVDKIIVKEDLMLAVLAASQDPSVVCILGTGSNCCFFNGKEIEQRVKAMGYILMDEGSGNHLGKELLKGYYHKELPEDLKFSLKKDFQLDDNKVLSGLYGATPNKYLAQYARFLFENIEHPYAKNIIEKCISDFIDIQLVKYKDELLTVPLYFIGSVGYHARYIIKDELAKRGFRSAENFIRRPLSTFIQLVKDDKSFLSNIV